MYCTSIGEICRDVFFPQNTLSNECKLKGMILTRQNKGFWRKNVNYIVNSIQIRIRIDDLSSKIKIISQIIQLNICNDDS